MSDIAPFDWFRLFVSDTPPLFYLEIAFRTLVVFVWLIVLLRATGRRSLAQLSAIEFAIVIALGSAVGDPMFYPEVPLLHAMLVMATVVGLQHGLARLIRRIEGNASAEKKSKGPRERRFLGPFDLLHFGQPQKQPCFLRQ